VGSGAEVFLYSRGLLAGTCSGPSSGGAWPHCPPRLKSAYDAGEILSPFISAGESAIPASAVHEAVNQLSVDDANTTSDKGSFISHESNSTQLN